MYNKTRGRAYPYAWLDEVVEVTLNPEKTNVIELEFQQLEVIAGQIDQELQSVLRNLKASTFYLISSKKIKATVKQYYDSLILLERQAMENLAAYPEDHHVATTGETIILYIRNTVIDFKKRYGKYITETGIDSGITPAKRMVVSKLLCKLSADQIGIILKAADDTKTVLASSMSVIFRSVVPYLSTNKNKNLSWDSMRKSTYHIEQSDKDVAIATLEKLILKIKGY
jgi:hypothetical protein